MNSSLQLRRRTIPLCLWPLVFGCARDPGGTNDSVPIEAVGGTTSQSLAGGGSTASTGGANLQVGTSDPVGGGNGSGDTITLGLGGTAAGETPIAGGSTFVVGGANGIGGVGGTAGTITIGGTTATGGSKATGGTTATGGSKATGGTTATGGSKATGGTTATGGSKATGGTTATGGSKATGGSSSTFSICSSAPPAGTRVVNIYVIGDSTASIYASDLYPRTGWGQVLGSSFSSACAVVVDKALSGRSSKSFYDEGAWTPIRNGLTAGDFVLIQFGHNDEKTTDSARYTDPQTTYKQYLTTYVNDTRAKQAMPILVTSINRNNWSGTTLSDSHGAYPPAVRELAVSLSVPLVDLTALTKTYFERIGQVATTNLFMNFAAGAFPNYPTGSTDNTHLREQGARDIAALFTGDAYRQKLPIASNLKSIPAAP